MSKFELKKIKVDSDGKVSISYKTDNQVEGSASYDTIEMESDRHPHPDLKEAINRLTPYLADANGLRPYRNLPHVPPKKLDRWNEPHIQEILNALDTHVYASVIPSGITLSGNDHTLGVIITGKHEVHNTAVAMNSPRISINADVFGFEAEVFDIVDTIVEEARLFIEERKSAQLELNFDQHNETKTQTEKKTEHLKAV